MIVDNNLRLELINESHAQSIFDMVDRNRAHLREWLPFVDKMTSVEFAQNFVAGTMQRNQSGAEYA
jgi:ribosomal-protein-serine acetyltransferase